MSSCADVVLVRASVSSTTVSAQHPLKFQQQRSVSDGYRGITVMRSTYMLRSRHQCRSRTYTTPRAWRASALHVERLTRHDRGSTGSGAKSMMNLGLHESVSAIPRSHVDRGDGTQLCGCGCDDRRRRCATTTAWPTDIAWSATIKKVSNDVVGSADILQLIGDATPSRNPARGTASTTLSSLWPTRRTQWAARCFASRRERRCWTFSRRFSGNFSPNMYRGTISACLMTMLSVSNDLSEYE